MAESRCLLNDTVGTGKFRALPLAAQALYVQLVLSADDEGIVEANAIMEETAATKADLFLLRDKGYVAILNSDFVTYILDWEFSNPPEDDEGGETSVYHDLLVSYLYG